MLVLALLLTTATPEWPPLRDAMLDRWLVERPAAGRALGLHAHDGKVADYSRAGIARVQKSAAADRSALAKVDATKLSPDDRLDLASMKLNAELTLFRLADVDEPSTRPLFYEELFAIDPYVIGEYAPLEERGRALVAHEEAALAQVKHIRANLKLPLSKAIAENAVLVIQGYAEYLRGDVKTMFAAVGDAKQQQRFAKANEALAVEADKLVAWLKADVVPQGDQSHVLGKERFLALLRAQEGLDVPLAELQHMADEDLQKNKSAYEAIVKKGARPVKPTTDLISLASAQSDEARKLVVDKKLVTIAFDEQSRVKEAPPFMRWNFAFLNATGPYEKKKISYYYIAPPDPSWPKEEQDAYVPDVGILRATTVHEVWPGHFLQARIAENAKTRPQRELGSYSFVEGWAHYAEQLMVEQGYFKDDAEKLGQLSDALLRNCRFVAAIGIHTAGMTIDEAARRFRDDCKQDKATAMQQAVRGTFDPGYFAYTLGKVQILQLRAEAQKQLGDKFSLLKFHDALLAHGSPPVPLLAPVVLEELAQGASAQ